MQCTQLHVHVQCTRTCQAANTDATVGLNYCSIFPLYMSHPFLCACIQKKGDYSMMCGGLLFLIVMPNNVHVQRHACYMYALPNKISCIQKFALRDKIIHAH